MSCDKQSKSSGANRRARRNSAVRSFPPVAAGAGRTAGSETLRPRAALKPGAGTGARETRSQEPTPQRVPPAAPGRGVPRFHPRAEDAVIHTAPCEEEAARNKEQFPELMDLGPGPALRAWLLEPGFGLEEAKTHPHALVLQQPDFQQPDFQQPDFQQPAAEEPSAPGGDASPAAEPQKKSKKRKRTSNAQPHRKVPSRDALGRLPRLRPLYQYINLPTPELMSPWEGDGAAPAGRGAAPGLERELQQGSVSTLDGWESL
ncbi:uncharacterized protein C16orf86 homolog isoform X3 [Numida meleagris]|uniref:uncharacterized protein C16orf86 homolog isoform X3 n=1 Tax=Numida meleagris TaxID=8996 RepID=UPI000B3DA4A5|nr:uncharacterized protein C16orf86 homolog isoform X3 [Numida meleagris]